MDYQNCNMYIESTLIREQVEDILRKQIISGELKSGEKISVRELSDTLKISATPINAAVRTLVSEGFLVAIPRKGAVVSDMCEISVRQIVYFRASLEGVAAFFAAENITNEELDQAKSFLALAQLAIKRRDRFALKEANSGFHSTIRNGSHSSFLVKQINNYRSFANSVRWNEHTGYDDLLVSYDEHTAIFNAVLGRKSAEAERLMVAHIRKGTKSASEKPVAEVKEVRDTPPENGEK